MVLMTTKGEDTVVALAQKPDQTLTLIRHEQLVGQGTDEDPYRTVIQLLTETGVVVAEDDSTYADKKTWFDANQLPKAA